MSPKSAAVLAVPLWAGFLMALAVTTPTPASASDAVQCYNEALGTVQETLASDCAGRIVTRDEAATLRKERRDYIQKVLTGPPGGIQGKQLAGLGSGFFVAADGSVITSHHVVEDCAVVSISPTFGERVIVSKVVADAESDLALLRADIEPPAVAPLNAADDMAILDPGFVIGYPDRGLVTIEPVMSAVEILQRESPTDRGPAIVVRGDVRRGNSGGPLLDSGGNVLGVVFAKVDSVNVYKKTGETVTEIGLALPARALEDFLRKNGVAYQVSGRRPPQPAARILEDARPFLVQVGCWR